MNISDPEDDLTFRIHFRKTETGYQHQTAASVDNRTLTWRGTADYTTEDQAFMAAFGDVPELGDMILEERIIAWPRRARADPEDWGV